MKLDLTALTLTAGLFWGVAMLTVAFANLLWPDYGRAFLNGVASIYPGYQPGSGIGSVVTVTLYGLVDGAIAGAIFGWLYNVLARQRPGGGGR